MRHTEMLAETRSRSRNEIQADALIRILAASANSDAAAIELLADAAPRPSATWEPRR